MSDDPAKVLALYEALVAQHDDVERKGKKTPYTSMNGNMFSFIGQKNELAFRLSDADRTAFLDKHPDSVVTQHNRVMKHYVSVPDSMMDDADAVTELFGMSVENAKGLKPKATKKKAPK